MPRHYRVDDLPQAVRIGFEAMSEDPAQTVDSLHAWLKRQKVRISRNAVWNAMRRRRDGLVNELREMIGRKSDQNLRARAHAGLGVLSGDALTHAALLIEIMASCQRDPVRLHQVKKRPATGVIRRGFKPRSNAK